MKRLLMIPVLLLALAVSGCAGTKVGDLLSVATSTITNPISTTDVYRLKNTYAATLELAVQYRSYCWSKSYAALMADPIGRIACKSRRAAVRAIQSAQPKAAAAVRAAESFVANNPTLNAASAISAAWSAVTAFQSAVPKLN